VHYGVAPQNIFWTAATNKDKLHLVNWGCCPMQPYKSGALNIMKIKRNLIQLCLLGTMLLTSPAIVQAQFTFTTNADNTITITSYTGSNGVVMIPGTIADLPVTSIGDWAFYATSVTNVLIPDTVTNIGDGAFFDCESLTNVTLGSSVTNIGDWTFAFCTSLTSVCGRGNAPSLEGGNVFYGNLATIYYLSEATGWEPMFDGHPVVLWNPPVPFNYMTNNGTITITGYTGPGGVAVAIPSTINFLPVTSIRHGAFVDCTFISVTIPNSVTSINNDASLECCNLTSVTIGNSVTSIADGAFWWCVALTNVTVPNSVTNIGNSAFNYCTSLSSIMIGNGVTSIGASAFCDCYSLSSVTIPNSVTSIGDDAFYSCGSLTNITIPNSVTSIGDEVFYGCSSLVAITVNALNSDYSSVDGVLFDKSTNTLIQCPGGKAGSFTIPDSVTSISHDAFYCCGSLSSVTIGNSVTNIGDEALYTCSSLVAITVNALNSVYSSVDGVLFDKSTNTLIHCPGGKAGSFTIPDGVTSIGVSAFQNCYNLTNVTIPNSVTSIGDFAFIYCGNLSSVTIGNNVTSIGYGAFAYCTILTNFTIGNSVTSIGDYAFVNCIGLSSVTIGNNVTNIGDYAFLYCGNLTCVTIPGSVTRIGDFAFWYCNSLSSVTIDNGVTSIGVGAFCNCSLTSITIPKSVTSIGGAAFWSCMSLTGVYFQGNALPLDSSVFNFDNSVTIYYLPGTTGWDDFSANTGIPTALWFLPNPLILNFEPSFGVQTNGFGFVISWATNISVIVEACTNLANPIWSPVGTNALTSGWCNFSDPQWTNFSGRFYRLRSP